VAKLKEQLANMIVNFEVEKVKEKFLVTKSTSFRRLLMNFEAQGNTASPPCPMLS
jgi:hypothetical protein